MKLIYIENIFYKILLYTIYLILSCNYVHAENLKTWIGKPILSKNPNIIPCIKKKNNLKNRYFAEQYSFWLLSDNGKSSRIQFISSNKFGFNKGELITKAEIRYGKGNKVKIKKVYNKKEWSFEKDIFSITAKNNTIYKSDNKYFIKLKKKHLQINIEISSLYSSWKPAENNIEYSEDGYFNTNIIVPFGYFKAEIINLKNKPNENKVIIFSGTTTAEHSLSTGPPHVQAIKWYEFRKLADNYSILFKQFITSKGYGKTPVNYMFFADTKQNIISSNNLNVNEQNLFTDIKSSNKYKIPLGLNIQSKNINISINLGTIIKRKDMISDRNFLIKRFIKFFSEPISYKISCNYYIKVTSKTKIINELSGKHYYYITHITK